MGGESPPHLWVIGPGRVGLALGLALHRAGAVGRLTYTGRRTAPPDHPLFEGSPVLATYSPSLSVPSPPPAAVVIAVADAGIAAVGSALASAGLPAGTPVLHTSGSLGAEVLSPLAHGGCATGSLHPLAAVPHPVEGVRRLRGAWYAVEGHATAAAFAERLVAALDGRILRVAPGAKPLYHAGAVTASNYLVALLSAAERWLVEAGVSAGDARQALASLARGALEGVEALGPTGALTGPISRGDVETVLAHLSRLSPPDRALYSVLARTTLGVALQGGLDAGAAERLAAALEEPE